MDNSEIVSNVIDYIEKNLKNELTVESLASVCGFSPYHFCRIFALYAGIPAMEYVRRRRLSHAANELWDGRRIADVAADYGFDTHSGFSKAFKRIYGYSPNEFCKRVSPHRPPMPNPLRELKEADLPREPVCRIERRRGFYIAGIILRTSADLSDVRQLPALWKDFQVYDVDSVVYAKARPREHGEYNICFPVGTGLYRHVNGVKLDDVEDVDSDLYVDYVPEATCAVFTTPPVVGTIEDFRLRIIDTWKFIYNDWFPTSGYEQDPNGRDYEFYDERVHGSGPYSMDICIPVVKKSQ